MTENFQKASQNLKSGGFTHHLIDQSSLNGEKSDEEVDLSIMDQWKIVKVINKFMMKYNHRVYNGYIYSKPEQGIKLNFEYKLKIVQSRLTFPRCLKSMFKILSLPFQRRLHSSKVGRQKNIFTSFKPIRNLGMK